MKISVLSGNPKTQGLCQSIIDAAVRGASEGNADVDEIRLCNYDIERCRICNDGWGACRDEHRCSYGSDGFDQVRMRLALCDAMIFVSPVYWHEPSEAFKSFADRLRRCERDRKETLAGKPVILIASAGGSGNGLLTCLEQMERFCKHTDALIFDLFGVNRWNRDYKRTAIKAAAYELASGRKHGDTAP